MPYPDDYIARGAPDDEPRHDEDAEPITRREAEAFERAAAPYRVILNKLREIRSDAQAIGTPEMITLAACMQDAINDCTPLAAILAWDSDDDPFFVRQAFNHMMDEAKTAKEIR